MEYKKYSLKDVESAWIVKEGKKIMNLTPNLHTKNNLKPNYYILKLKDSNLIIQETSVEVEDNERYILFGESDPNHYSELTTIAIMQEFADVNLVKVEIKQ